MLWGSFHDAVLGAAASLFAKYGDRAASINLCRWKVSSCVVIVMSVVFGVGRDRREVTCAARGCRGFVDLA
jgi:hypothetical protein